MAGLAGLLVEDAAAAAVADLSVLVLDFCAEDLVGGGAAEGWEDEGPGCRASSD